MRRPYPWKACAGGALTAAFLLITAVPAVAGFDYTTFDDVSLSLNGTAAVVKTGPGRRNVLRLTDGGRRQAGSAWATDRIDVTESFETTFLALLHHGASGADGIALVVQASGPKALGAGGGGLGYRGLGASVAVEFDDFRNGTEPSGDHVALVTGGDPGHHPVATEAAIPLFGAPFQARVCYDAATRRLTVRLAPPGAEDGEQLVVDRTIDLRDHLGADTAWIGFTGSTGDVTSKQDIITWSLDDSAGD